MTHDPSPSADTPKPKLGILAGGGRLPELLVDACKQENRPYFILGFEGAVNPALLDGEPHKRIRLGAIGEALQTLKSENVGELVMAGRLKRPGLATLKPDGGGAKLLAKLGKSFFSGDNSLLSSIVNYLEEEGFTVVGADDVLSDLLAPPGLVGRIAPPKDTARDIEIGVKVAHTIGDLDIGQAVIIQQGYILGVEAAEGTDALIARCGELKRNVPYGGVLVKVKKPAQERRVDLPTIGVETVEAVARAGFSGIAVEAGGVLVIDRKGVALKADALGVFVVGFSQDNEAQNHASET